MIDADELVRRGEISKLYDLVGQCARRIGEGENRNVYRFRRAASGMLGAVRVIWKRGAGRAPPVMGRGPRIHAPAGSLRRIAARKDIVEANPRGANEEHLPTAVGDSPRQAISFCQSSVCAKSRN
jgi:hypothetical protein